MADATLTSNERAPISAGASELMMELFNRMPVEALKNVPEPIAKRIGDFMVANGYRIVFDRWYLQAEPHAPETPEQLPESLSDPAIVMERVRALHQRTDAALWLLRYLNRLGGLGQDKHRLIDAVLEGRAKVLGDTLHIEQPSEKASE